MSQRIRYDEWGAELDNPEPEDFSAMQNQIYQAQIAFLSTDALALFDLLTYARCAHFIPSRIVRRSPNEIQELCNRFFAIWPYGEDWINGEVQLVTPLRQWNWVRLQSSLDRRQNIFNYACDFYWREYSEHDMSNNEQLELFDHIDELRKEYELGGIEAGERFAQLLIMSADRSDLDAPTGIEGRFRELATDIRARP